MTLKYISLQFDLCLTDNLIYQVKRESFMQLENRNNFICQPKIKGESKAFYLRISIITFHILPRPPLGLVFKTQ